MVARIFVVPLPYPGRATLDQQVFAAGGHIEGRISCRRPRNICELISSRGVRIGPKHDRRSLLVTRQLSRVIHVERLADRDHEVIRPGNKALELPESLEPRRLVERGRSTAYSGCRGSFIQGGDEQLQLSPQ